MARFWLWFWGFVTLAIITLGGMLAAQQSRLIRGSTRVEGVVLESEVKRYSGKRTRHGPRVRVRYAVAGKEYETTRFYPLGGSPRSRSRASAEQWVAKYPVGKTVQMYVPAHDASRGYLMQRYESHPYLLMILGPIPLLIAALIIASLEPRDKPPTPVPGTDPPLYELPMGPSPGAAARTLLPAAAIAVVAAGLGAWHGSHVRVVSGAVWVPVAITGVLTIITVVAGTSYLLAARAFGRPRILVDAPVARRGSALLAVVECAAPARALAPWLAGLRCTVTQQAGKNTTTTHPHDEKREVTPVVGPDPLDPGRRVARAAVALAVPGEHPASTTAKENPSVRWQVRVKLRAAGAPDANVEGAIRVE
ncbi:MAG TPA: DUF3592 domain-containing protein [Phycisphaerales bacterium]|nr:DUF3592 domain-containing protein [Phycisphaerales bacterium]